MRWAGGSGGIIADLVLLAMTKTFTDPRLCAAIVDRLTVGGNIIETDTHSYHLARTRKAWPQKFAP